MVLQAERPVPDAQAAFLQRRNKLATLKSDWINRAFPYSELIQILNFYLDLECWIIPADDWDSWYCIRKYRRRTWPLNYDHRYGKREERLRFNETQFKRVLRERKTVVANRRGLSDLFVPILKKGKVIGILELGDFLREPPTKEGLQKQWKDLTGFEASGSNIDFLRYVRIVLETPVLEDKVYLAMRRILEAYAKVLAGEEDPLKAQHLAADLKVSVIARHFHNLLWLEKVIQENWVYPPTWIQPQLGEWEKEELGLGRLPTTILAVGTEYGRSGVTVELDRILKNYQFQRELLRFSGDLRNTMAHPLGDFGMLFFTSPDPAKDDVQSKLEILDLLGQVSRFAEKQLHAKVLAGVGRCPRPGGNLAGVYRQAVTALSFCDPLGRSVLFYEDIQNNPKVPAPDNYYDWSNRLVEACLRIPLGDVETARNQYVEMVLAHSAGQLETVRLHFFYTFGRIVGEWQKRPSFADSNLAFLYKTFERRLQEAENTPDLIGVFRESLEGILEMKAMPRETAETIRLEAVRGYIDENLKRPLKLEEVAREHGFSVSVFGRVFKKTVGMGFSAYLRQARLERAKKLLRSTRIPIKDISLECGFGNLQYFFDLFKSFTGNTPKEYRGK